MLKIHMKFRGWAYHPSGYGINTNIFSIVFETNNYYVLSQVVVWFNHILIYTTQLLFHSHKLLIYF